MSTKLKTIFGLAFERPLSVQGKDLKSLALAEGGNCRYWREEEKP
jgi:hypothetical protein